MRALIGPLGGLDAQNVPFVLDIFELNLGPDIEVFMLDEMLDILDIFLHRDRFVGGAEFLDQERLGVFLGLEGIHILPFRIGIGDPLEYGFPLLDQQIVKAAFVAEVGGGYPAGPPPTMTTS